MSQEDIGRQVIHTIHNHPNFENTELCELAIILAKATAITLGVQIRDDLDKVPEGYPNKVKQIFLNNFIINFDNQISKGKGK